MQLTLLLPSLSRLRDAPLSPLAALMLGRGERLADAEPGRQAQLRRYFDLPENEWPLAALTREHECGDAEDALWLRADPCHIRPDINGARLLAVGHDMLDDEDTVDVKALQPVLREVFASAGFHFDMGDLGGWYLKLPDGTSLPDTLTPDEALGLDLVDHHIITATGGGRRWRALLSEAEIALHHHPYNAKRIKAGKLAINSLWFWGGGTLPERVGTRASAFHSGDEMAWALASAAGVFKLIFPEPASRYVPYAKAGTVFDLSIYRSMSELNAHWLHPVMHALTSGEVSRLHIDTEDGQRWNLRPAHRWRVWRKPWNPAA